MGYLSVNDCETKLLKVPQRSVTYESSISNKAVYTQPLRLFGREVPGWSSDIVRKPSGFFEFFERKCMREKLHEQFHDQLTLKPKFHDQFNPHHDQLAAPAPELGGCPRTPSERLRVWDSRMEDCLGNVTIIWELHRYTSAALV
jgi:hypothetical protein